MLGIIYHNQFEKDIKRTKKRGKDLHKLKIIIQSLVAKEQLPVKYRDHPLKENYKDSRECHIEPDWLLIYKITDSAIILERTGTHSDLFK